MKKSIVVLSPNDPKLLIKLFDELLGNGFLDDEEWNSQHSPSDDNQYYAMCIDWWSIITYHNHDCKGYDMYLNLTESNYSEVLQTILNERQ